MLLGRMGMLTESNRALWERGPEVYRFEVDGVPLVKVLAAPAAGHP